MFTIYSKHTKKSLLPPTKPQKNGKGINSHFKKVIAMTNIKKVLILIRTEIWIFKSRLAKYKA